MRLRRIHPLLAAPALLLAAPALLLACRQERTTVVARQNVGSAPQENAAKAAPASTEPDAGTCDDDAACGNMFGDTIGDSFGAGGLGLTGTGSDCVDAGLQQAIGLGNMGGTGHGAGTGAGLSDAGCRPGDASP